MSLAPGASAVLFAHTARASSSEPASISTLVFRKRSVQFGPTKIKGAFSEVSELLLFATKTRAPFPSSS